MRVDRSRGVRMSKADDNPSQQLACFYVFPVIFLQQIRGVDVICWLPSVIALGVSSSLYQIL
jgi:hypothetical protein